MRLACQEGVCHGFHDMLEAAEPLAIWQQGRASRVRRPSAPTALPRSKAPALLHGKQSCSFTVFFGVHACSSHISTMHGTGKHSTNPAQSQEPNPVQIQDRKNPEHSLAGHLLQQHIPLLLHGACVALQLPQLACKLLLLCPQHPGSS